MQDLKLEVVVVPVSDVDRAKHFYEGLAWRTDADLTSGDGQRVVQLTPPGSECSIHLRQGKNDGRAALGPGTWLIVSDIEAAHAELVGRGIEVTDIWHGPPFPVEARQPGPDPERASYGSFCAFSDPDGNTWIVQEVTTRLPGRV